MAAVIDKHMKSLLALLTLIALPNAVLANENIWCENEFKRRGFNDYTVTREDIVQIAYSSSSRPNDDEFEECENAKYDIGRTAMDFECNGVLLGRTIYMPLAPVENYIYDKSGNSWKADQSTAVTYNKWNDRECKKISDNLYVHENGDYMKIFVPQVKIWVVRKNHYIRRYTPIKYRFDKPNF